MLGEGQLGVAVQIEAERAERLVKLGYRRVDGVMNCAQVPGQGLRYYFGHRALSSLS